MLAAMAEVQGQAVAKEVFRLTRSTAQGPAFQGGDGERRSGPALSEVEGVPPGKPPH
jgi:hypothetical protein